MTNKKQKLELTWFGKGDEVNLEPRILVEVPEKSYGDTTTGNMLIHGDNLLALKALEQDYTGKIKCIYIDPPYNTGSAFEHYDDNVEHSKWLSLMKQRLEILHTLLAEDGSIWITLDYNEVHYAKVLCDEIFDRKNFVASIVWRSSDNSNNDAKQFSLDHNDILIYAKNDNWLSNKLARDESQTKHYSNPDNDPRGPWFDGNPLGSPSPRPNLTFDIIAPNGNIIKPPLNGWRWSEDTLKEKMQTGEIRFNENYTAIKRRTYLLEQPGIPPSSLWINLDVTGHNRQAKYEQKKLFPEFTKNEWFGTPKPEKLINYILKISTNEGDLVLDSFLGSGTTAAVAQKMGRRWIGIELGEHCYTHCEPRLHQVIDGTDQGGISKAVNWQGGGGYKFYELAPSLLKKDEFGNWIIEPKYDAEMLAEAMAKHEGYKFSPDEKNIFKQGHSTEKDFIFTTTQFISFEMLEKIRANLKENESLLICATHFEDGTSLKYENITIKKIPQILLNRCEFGKLEYNLNIEEKQPEDFEDEEPLEDEE